MTSANSVPEHCKGVPLRDSAVSFAFRLYKSLLSPVMHAVAPSRCVYLPTCSEYAYTAVSRFGLLRGSWMTLCRLLRCNPFAKGGLDPVPERTTTVVRQDSSFTPSGSGQKGTDHLP
jgi:uncharacterized protein